MAGGKIHGKGGHGRYARELAQKLKHKEKQKQIISRKKEKKVRRFERDLNKIKEEFVPGLSNNVKELTNKVLNDVKRKKVTKNNALKIMLAANEWFIEEVEKKLIEKKIITKNLSEKEREQIAILDSSKVINTMASLLSEKPTILEQKQLIEDINKWKRRIPKLLLGHY